MKCCAISELSAVLVGRCVVVVFCHIRNSGVFGVMVSGGMFFVPVCLSCMFFLFAVIDSSARNVCILSPVFCLVVLMCMVVAVGFSRMMLQLSCLRSDTPMPVSFAVVISAVVGVLACWSIFCSASVVALSCPVASPFG